MTIKYFFQLICFVWLIEPLQAAPPLIAQPGCRDTCGDVTIPYPFGIGTPNCFLNEWYEVVCHDDRPYLSKYYGQEFGGEVLNVYIDLGIITINANNSRLRVCEEKSISLTGFLSESPFKFVYNYNKLTFVGCGNVMMLFGNQTILGGCTSTCDHPYRKVDGCLGNHCCQISIPSSDFQNIYLNFTNLVIRNNSCPYAVFGDEPSFSDENLLEVSYNVVLQWKIPEWMGLSLKSNPNCGISGNDGYYDCHCSACVYGNPYILNGCQGHSNEPNCASRSRKRLIMLVVIGTSFGIFFLGTAGLLLYKLISKKRERKLKKNFFIRNGGLLLQQQLSVDENIVNKVRFFTSIELDKATDNFNENRVLGRGGQGTVYKGMLVDGKIVAVKKSKLDDKKQVEQFINEVVLLSQINHRNVVKLLGCCLETDVPLLVYEFIPNGTLYDLMHNENDEFIMSWDMRLRIAREVAEALAYLHSATYVPIYHRDIKSSNILLDENHIAKVSDFGISRNVSIDHTHITTIVKGTFGYLDPEYFQSSQFTDKSDVYSFGVVLVELLTRQKPIPSPPTEGESYLGLAGQFLVYMEEDHLNMILDAQISDTATDEQVSNVAILAQRCLSLDGRKRPTMKEVAMELESIKMSHMTLTEQTDFGKESDIGVELVVNIPDGNTSSCTSTNGTITSSSDAYPIMSNTL